MAGARLARLSPHMRVIAWRLTEGRCVSVGELVQALYGNRQDGGPLYADNGITVRVAHVRQALRPHGITIGVRYGFGWFVQPEDVDRLRALLAGEIEDHLGWVQRRRNRYTGRLTAAERGTADRSHEAAIGT